MDHPIKMLRQQNVGIGIAPTFPVQGGTFELRQDYPLGPIAIYWGRFILVFNSSTSLSAELIVSFSLFFSRRANLR